MLQNILFYEEEFEILVVDGKSLGGFMRSYYILQRRSRSYHYEAISLKKSPFTTW